MAEGDNHARFTGTAQVALDTELGPTVAKGNPATKARLEEAGATIVGRDTFYAGATEKDRLPEHTARRTAYPLILAK